MSPINSVNAYVCLSFERNDRIKRVLTRMNYLVDFILGEIYGNASLTYDEEDSAIFNALAKCLALTMATNLENGVPLQLQWKAFSEGVQKHIDFYHSEIA